MASEATQPTAPPAGEPATGSARAAVIVLFVVAAALVSVSDLWSKEAVFDLLEVETRYTPAGQPVVRSQQRYDLFEGWFQLEANYNYGAFSGWFSKNTGALAVVSFAAMIIIGAIALWHAFKSVRPEWMFTLALGLLWGGTFGNLYDRWLLSGVRDWIKWYVVIDGKEHVWPNFNVADAAICTGVALILLREFLIFLRQRREAKAAAEG